jgi:hypothetical protein
MPLLAEFDLQPPVSDAHSIDSHVKVRSSIDYFFNFLCWFLSSTFHLLNQEHFFCEASFLDNF